MSRVRLSINGLEIETAAGTTILDAAKAVDIYIPTLCYHPDLPPAKGVPAQSTIFQGDKKIENQIPEIESKGCGLCVVEVEGRPDLVGACDTEIEDGMKVITESERVRTTRQENLVPILARHRHACLTCAQQEGCPRTQCSSNVPENERCCSRFGFCELQDVAHYIGISDSTPKWVPTDLPIFSEDPLYERDYSLCIGCTRCVRACRDLRGAESLGFVVDQNGTVQVGTVRPGLMESGCKFCTACVEVCPTGALMDKAVRPGKKEEDLVPCKAACPVHIDIPGYLRLIAEGRGNEANAVIREKVPFPGTLGRVCIRPCEEACRRGEINDPVAICALKRFAGDTDKGLWQAQVKIPRETGKQVAIVGAGPAGLTAAFYLRKQGHSVTVFDADQQAGGMLRFGIPSYRLPADVLDKEICEIFSLGIQFEPGRVLGKDITLDQLKNDGFEAIFLAIGAQLSRKIPLDGCDHQDVLWGVDFLKQVARGEDIRLKERVLVIGGGNVAIDVALSAKRMGATDVLLACLEGKGEMPANSWEIEGAEAEGIQIMPSWGPERILSEGGKVTGMDLVECTCLFDEQGSFCPQFNEDSKECILVDQLILAVGQSSELSFLEADSKIVVKNGLIVVNPESLETGMKGVYAGGDVTRMPGAVIHAIAAGRDAATAIDKAFGGDGDIDEILFKGEAPQPFIGREESFAWILRETVLELDLGLREDFTEISLGFDKDQAVKEAKRCLQCDLRLTMDCNPSPPSNGFKLIVGLIRQVPASEGVYQLLDEDHNIQAIKGTADMRASLMEEMENNQNAALFVFEEDKMYSKRESELIQKYLQEHGAMPGAGGSDLEDLY